jgi:hypothetical protein
MWKSFIAWSDYYQPEFLYSEYCVWSHTHGYAGTGDFIAKIRNRIIFGDHKTGTNLYPEVGLQLSAAINADAILTPDGEEIPVPGADAAAALHIRPMSASLIPVRHIDDCWTTFLAALQIMQFKGRSSRVLGTAPKITWKDTNVGNR